jgi:hypothetical protein
VFEKVHIRNNFPDCQACFFGPNNPDLTRVRTDLKNASLETIFRIAKLAFCGPNSWFTAAKCRIGWLNVAALTQGLGLAMENMLLHAKMSSPPHLCIK